MTFFIRNRTRKNIQQRHKTVVSLRPLNGRAGHYRISASTDRRGRFLPCHTSLGGSLRTIRDLSGLVSQPRPLASLPAFASSCTVVSPHYPCWIPPGGGFPRPEHGTPPSKINWAARQLSRGCCSQHIRRVYYSLVYLLCLAKGF